MPIPADILAVERPKNTVVYAYGKNKDRYGVKQRIGCKYKNGKNYPVNGPTVGHIINGEYVPIENNSPQPISMADISIKEWGGVQLCLDLIDDLRKELLQLYNQKDTNKILAIAILRVLHPGITNCELKEKYDESFLSEFLPDTALSRNTVSTFLNNLGKTYDRIISFMRLRAGKVGIDHHLLVDGTLKTNDSTQNTLSEFSRKARLKGRSDLSVLYAFDLEKMEPVCSQCFPGNMLDLTAYEDFVRTNGIKNGILVGDKGFPMKSIEAVLNETPELHYFNPLLRSSSLAKEYEMYDFDGVMEGQNGFLGRPEPIQYKKQKLMHKKKWLYSFRDPDRAAVEENDWLDKHRGEKYDGAKYAQKKELFGTVVFESDVDLSVEDAWKTYSYRWQIEIVMRYYKDALGFDVTCVQDDYSVLGSEFIDFISTVITFHLINLFDEKHLFENLTYKKIMRILERAKKIRVNGEWVLTKMNPSQIELLQKLELLPAPEVVKKKRGRPPKKPTIV